MVEEPGAEHLRAAEAHEKAAILHDERAATLLQQGDVERAGREVMEALIERQLAEDEHQLAQTEESRLRPAG